MEGIEPSPPTYKAWYATITLHALIYINEWWTRGDLNSQLVVCKTTVLPIITTSPLMVDEERIERSSSPCKGGILPLNDSSIMG